MTDNTDDRREQNGRSTGSEQPRVQSDQGWSRERWESLHGNPDEHGDLGYEYSEWERFETLDGADQIMFLPEDESEIKDAAFVITETGLPVDLSERC